MKCHRISSWGHLPVRSWLQQVRHIPWPFIILFDVAALLALVLSIALVASAEPRKSIVPKPAASTGKRIAFSFDDAPRGPGAFLNAQTRPQMLIGQLKAAGVKQAVFFVNPARIDASNGHAAILSAYTHAGHLLADHTAHHLRLSAVPAEAFLADVDAAEAWLKAQQGYRPWFRFPELDEGGRDAAKRDAVRAGLEKRGLKNGYVTADGWDWYLDSLTAKAAQAGKPMDMDGLRTLYVESHVEAANFADKLARKTLGHPPAQILLLHDTDLAALYLGDLARALRADGWTIISADEAYAKPLPQATRLPDINGTRIQMLAREKGVPGPYWFERNEVPMMKRLFTERVLHE